MASKKSSTNNSRDTRSNNQRSSVSKNPSGGNSIKPNHYNEQRSNNNNSEYYSSKENSNNVNYNELNTYSKGDNQYDNNEPINDPPYDDYDNSHGKGSRNNNSDYNDNYDSESNYSKGNNQYDNNEPINDPPYDDYDNSHGKGSGGNNSNHNNNYDSGSNYSKGNNQYDNNEPINDPPYDNYDNNYSHGKGSRNNNSDYNDNYDSESNYSKGNNQYDNNEPINDPPYDDYDNSHGKGSGGNNSNHNNNYNPNDSNESFSKTPNNISDNSIPIGKGGGDANTNETNNTTATRASNSNPSGRQTNSRGVRGFIERFGTVRFRNSNEINRFFAENSNSPDFMHWFKDNIGGRGHWRERSLRNISQQDAQSFNRVWDKIQYLFRGRNENYAINLFQFFGLVSIMINEVGSRFTPIRERGSLSYMFNTVIPATARRPQRTKTSYNNPRNNMTAYQLFNDEHFLRAHSGMPRYNSVANTSNRVWHGTEYPSGVVTRPSAAGIIAEADFYKFRGRGLIQTTWSGSYIRLIEHTLHYNGNNPIILEYKNEWQQSMNQHGSLRIIASQTKNRDWDRLFMETQNEFACIAVYKFQEHRNRFLEEIEVNAGRLQGTSVGSLYYIGYKVGGRSTYGDKVKDRCLQMINKLLEHRQS